MENDSYYQKVERRLERNKKVLAQKQRAVLRDEEILDGLKSGNANYVPKTKKGEKKEVKSQKVTKNETKEEIKPEKTQAKSVLDEIFEE
tara:strand:+ start:22503 stop:22769 length:267 start_codon:yes stop_codon:yes gene_type:complete